MTHLRSRLLVAGTLTILGVCAIAIGLGAQVAPVTRGPYLQMGTASGVVVRWRTATAVDSVVRYGTAPGGLTSVVSVPGARTEHEVAIGGLTPHTRYFYSVGTTAAVLAGGDRDHTFTTSPPTGARAPLRLWVLGDAGTANATARAVRDGYLARENTGGTQAVLFLGDNAYPNGTDAEYQAAVFDTFRDVLRRAVSWSTFGNHDAGSASAATQTGPYFDVFTLPRQGQAGGIPSGTEAYYSFDLANVHVVSLDSTESDRSASGRMATWLRADLAANQAEWTIAFFHHAPYSRGTHDSDVDPNMREMREQIVPLLEAGGVDLVLAGHSHTYERTALISGHYGAASTFGPANVVDGGPGADGYQKLAGTRVGALYVLSGSAGATARSPLDHPAMQVAFANTGSVALDVDGERLRVTFIRDPFGAYQDSFLMLKPQPTGPPGAPWGVAPGATAATADYLYWQPPTDGGRIDGYRLEAGTAPGRSDVGVLTLGRQTVLGVGGPAGVSGRFFVRVRAFNAAGLGPPSDETVLTVSGDPRHEVMPAAPEWEIDAVVTGSTVRLAGGQAPYPYAPLLEVGSRPGASDLGTIASAGGLVTGVPAGVYFLRARLFTLAGLSPPTRDTMVVVGGVPSPPDRPGLPRAAVVGRAVGITWAPPPGPAVVDRYVVEAGVLPRASSVRLATPDARPQLTVAGVPPGTYYVRVRGVNAMGEGVTSADTRVVVP